MHDSFVLKIFLDLGCNRSQIANDIGVREHYSLRLGRRARSKNYLQRITRRNLYGTKTLARMQRNYSGQLAWIDNRNSLATFSLHSQFGEAYRPLASTNHQPCFCLGGYLTREIRRGRIVNRNDNHAANPASKKGRDPLGTVLAPQNDRISLRDLARFQFARKLVRHSRHAPVAPSLMTVTPGKSVGALRPPAFEIVQRIE